MIYFYSFVCSVLGLMTMADRQLLYTCLVLCLVHYGQSASITFSPPSPLLITANETQPGSGRPVTVTCSHPPSIGLLALNLFKNSTTGLKTRLMYAATGASPVGTNGSPQLIDSGTSGTVTGNIAQGSISLTYSQASCDTAGLYTCSSSVQEAGDVQKPESSANYIVTVNPGQASIAVVAKGTPSGSSWYMVGDEVTLTCNIDVGTVEQTTQVNFVWQYEVDNGFGGKEFQIYPITEDIETTSPQPVTQKCQTQTRISTLNRNLTTEDSERRYKCYITKGGTSYEVQAGFATMSEVKADGYVTSAPSTDTAAKAEVGMIVGIIIAILVVIAVVVVIVVFVIRHRKQQEQEGAYEPEKPPEPISSVPPPYTSEPPRFSRTDKPRSGHTNKAMDDEHDGKEPEKEKERSKNRDRGDKDPDRERRYDGRQPRQEYETGKRNPAYERNVDDPRGRRYSSDDGGTDVNRSISLGEGDHTIGSAV